ncbi:hypothetical protein NPX13_g9391 [Xylaria arbuscula]|uniref:Uncharacterized protein n=1 Tax=Xylaria arbuscula TaxID=114810 RepID=A0A9W8N6X3_9PEZI|nr:hypothetical protein NPX13_g9391 [Xylaria arbuscula]
MAHHATKQSSRTPIAESDTPSPTPKTKRRRRMHISPQPGSLYDILHDNAGKQLYVRPLSWSDLHTKLLGCRFVQLPALDTPAPASSIPEPYSTSPSPSPPTLPHWSPLKKAPNDDRNVNMSKILGYLMTFNKPEEAKNRAMRAMLSNFYPQTFMYPQDEVDLSLRFGACRYPRSIRCQLLYNHIYPSLNMMSFDSTTTWSANHSASQTLSSTISTSNEPSILAYINRSRIHHIRTSCHNIIRGPQGISNDPVQRLQALRAKALLPQNRDEDAYLIAVVLALAQQSTYPGNSTNHGFAPRDVKVHVLTIAEEEDSFIVYTAIVPSALLSMFHEPDVAPTGDSQIQVEYARVPAWPVEDLQERLGAALGPDIIGDVIPPPTYHYEDQTTSSVAASPMSFYQASGSKRKRGVFSEVMNASFYEDRESDGPKDAPAKRRRLLETKSRRCSVIA